MKSYTLRCREQDRYIFDAIKNGNKKVETRVASNKYRYIQKGDELVFICGHDRLSKKVGAVAIYKSFRDLLKKYKPSNINPNLKTANELKSLYNSFSGYKEKIKNYGIIAMEMK